MRHRALTITPAIVVGAIVVQLNSLAVTQGSLEPLDDPESYAVYRALLPTEWTVRVARAKTLVFQKETTTYSDCTPSGMPLETEWRPVVESFKAENAKARIVLPGYDLGLPYVVAASADIQATFNAVPNDPMFGRSGFYKQYPDSGGFMQVSAVGFDAQKRRAMVYMAHICGGLCGGGSYRFLEKIDGAWREAKIPGVTNCLWVS